MATTYFSIRKGTTGLLLIRTGGPGDSRKRTFTWRENEAEYHWTDDKGLAIWWGQKRRVMVLKELYALEQDKASAYLLDRENHLYEMIEHDLTVGNPSNWVEDMIGRVRSGMSQNEQKGDSINNNLMSTGYSAMQESVEKNKEGFTKRQVECANRARSGYHMAGAPDMK